MDDDDFGGGSSRGMGGAFFALRMMESVMVPVLMVGLLIPVTLYVVARWRDNRNPEPDPQLGLKFALSFFKWQGYQVTLVGVTMLLYSITTKMPGEAREMIYRPAFGMLLPGLLVFGVTSWAMTRTNHQQAPIAGRLIAGFQMMVTGAIGFFLLIMAFQSLFKKGSGGDEARLIWSATLVYVAAWATQTVLFMNEVGVGIGGAAYAPPGSMSPPGSAAPPQ